MKESELECEPVRGGLSDLAPNRLIIPDSYRPCNLGEGLNEGCIESQAMLHPKPLSLQHSLVWIFQSLPHEADSAIYGLPAACMLITILIWTQFICRLNVD